MNHRERVLTALNRGIPDRVPTFDWFDDEVIYGLGEALELDGPRRGQLSARHGEEPLELLELLANIIKTLGMDGAWHSFAIGIERESDDFGRDKYDRGYMLSDHGLPVVIDPPINNPADLIGYNMADRLEKSDFDRALYTKSLLPDHAHAMSINGPFQETWLIRGGMDKLMIDFVERPDFAHACLRETTEFNKRAISLAAELGFDYMMVDGDLCGNVTTLVSLDHFKEFLLPYKQEIVAHSHACGLKIVKHCDGVVWPLIDLFIEAGFDGFHPVQPQCMEIGTTKAYLKDRVAVLGNIDCLDLLVFRTPEEVDRAVYETIQIAAPGGGYLCCSSNSLHNGCKPENVIAMVEAIHKYGNYDDIPDEAPPQPSPPPLVNGTPPPRQRRTTRRRKK